VTMDILLTNDDGIYTEGIYALYKALSRLGRVHVVAPEAEQSAVGHAITMSQPLRVKQVYRRKRCFGTAVSGTPADCVKIAVRSLLKRQPDLVVSGINLGPNTGLSALYSGTVSGATEGAIFGIPSFAVSLGTFKDPDFRYAARCASMIAKGIIKHGLPKGTYLNVNVPAIPAKKIKGIRVVKQGQAPIIEDFDKRVDPRDRVYYWLSGEVINLLDEDETDIACFRKGYVTVTPLKYDLTDHGCLQTIGTWKILKARG